MRGFDRLYLNLNSIYEEAENRRPASHSSNSQGIRIESRQRLLSDIYEEQDHRPVSQTFVFYVVKDSTQKKDLSQIKAQLNYVDQSRVMTGDQDIAELRLCQ